jgi:small GTP-binding protein
MKNLLFKKFISITIATLNLFSMPSVCVFGNEIDKIKIVIVGETEAGKTCLFERLSGKRDGTILKKEYTPTNGVQVFTRFVTSDSNKQLELELKIWEIGSGERFRVGASATQCLSGANILIFLARYDKNSGLHVESFKYWKEQAEEKCPNAKFICAINKFCNFEISESKGTLEQMGSEIPNYCGTCEIDVLTGEGYDILYGQILATAESMATELHPEPTRFSAESDLPAEPTRFSAESDPPAEEEKSFLGSHPLILGLGSIFLIAASAFGYRRSLAAKQTKPTPNQESLDPVVRG